MKSRKGFLQKTALVSGALSFVAAIICVLFLYLKARELGMGHPVSASFIAGIFFFLFVGSLLIYIGKADIPSFSVREHQCPPSD